MFFELLMRLIIVTFDGCVFQGPLHAFDLPVRPWMLGSGAAMYGGVLLTNIREGVNPEENRLRRLGFFLVPGRFWRVVDEV